MQPKVGRSGFLPAGDDEIRSEVSAVTSLALNVGGPALKFPITLKDELDFKKVASYLYIPELLKLWQHSPVDHCPRAQPYDTMPGPIDPLAPRSSNFLFTLNPRLKGLQTTGIYVPPGEVVTVTLSGKGLLKPRLLAIFASRSSGTDASKLEIEGSDRVSQRCLEDCG